MCQLVIENQSQEEGKGVGGLYQCRFIYPDDRPRQSATVPPPHVHPHGKGWGSLAQVNAERQGERMNTALCSEWREPVLTENQSHSTLRCMAF